MPRPFNRDSEVFWAALGVEGPLRWRYVGSRPGGGDRRGDRVDQVGGALLVINRYFRGIVAKAEAGELNMARTS
jgi:hypothetical protein